MTFAAQDQRISYKDVEIASAISEGQAAHIAAALNAYAEREALKARVENLRDEWAKGNDCEYERARACNKILAMMYE